MKILDGFTLIQFSIFLLLFSFLASLTMFFAISIHRTMILKEKMTTQFLMHQSGKDMFTRDTHTAPLQTKKWKKVSATEIVWHNDSQNKDIGWLFDNKSLFRIEGKYSNNMWNKKTKSKILMVENVQFEIKKSKNNIRLVCILQGDDLSSKTKWQSASRNGPIL